MVGCGWPRCRERGRGGHPRVYSRGVFVPVLNIVLGGVMVVGGLTGQLALLGTHSSTALVIAGVICAALGVFQLVRAIKRGY